MTVFFETAFLQNDSFLEYCGSNLQTKTVFFGFFFGAFYAKVWQRDFAAWSETLKVASQDAGLHFGHGAKQKRSRALLSKFSAQAKCLLANILIGSSELQRLLVLRIAPVAC